MVEGRTSGGRIGTYSLEWVFRTLCLLVAERRRSKSGAARVHSKYNTSVEYSDFPPATEVAHAVQFYTEEDFLLKGLCGFIRMALAEGQSLVLIMTEVHHKALKMCLRSAGIDVRSAAKQGRYQTLDAARTLARLMDGNVVARSKFISEIGTLIEQGRTAALAKDKPVAVFGEMVAVLWAERRYQAAIDLERLWNELAKTHEFYLRCAYPANGFEGDMKVPYATICAEHSHVYPTT